MQTPLGIAIIGMGGFAGAHHDAVLTLEQQGECRLVGACDPRMDVFAERRQALQFTERGVREFTDFRAMLDACGDALDVVTIPTPIPLHAPMHRACVERGLAVYLEKPPTVNWQELEEMIAAEDGTAKMANVGFNYLVEQQRQALKARLVNGEFGTATLASYYGMWPRNSAYYGRARWAGRLLLDGALVLDSPVGNAMAHHIHNMLYWCGMGAVRQWGEVTAVDAELYRAHPIDGMDTAFLRADIASGPELRIAASHACVGPTLFTEQVVCEHATITYDQSHGFTVRWHDGREEVLPDGGFNYPVENIRAYLRYVRGETPHPLTSLADSRPFVHLNNLAYLASGRVATVPEGACTHETNAHGHVYTAIADLENIAQRFLQTGAFPSTQQVAWAAAGGRATRDVLPSLADAVARMSNMPS